MPSVIIHYPNLKTVLMVEETLKNADKPLTKTELKAKLPKEVMHQTLNVILEYMENRGMIIFSSKGIVWIYNQSPKLQKAIEKGVEWI